MERLVLQLLGGIRLHLLNLLRRARGARPTTGGSRSCATEKEGIHGPIIGERLVGRAVAQRRGEARGGGVRVAEEVDVLRHVLVEAADRQGVLRVLVVAEAAVERHVRVGLVRNPRPVDPVGEEGEAGVGRGEVLAGGGEPGVEEVEVRPRVRAHAVAGHGGGEGAVVARAVVAELHHLEAEVVSAAQLVAREVVAEAQEAPHAVEAALDVAHVAADDERLALARLHVLHVLHERHDDRLALLGRERLPDPVVRAERVDARGGVPVDGASVAVGGVVGGDARHEHLAGLVEVFPLAGEPPRERAFGRLGSPFLHARDRRRGGGLVRARGGLDLAEHHGVEAGADGVAWIAVAPFQELVARRACGAFCPRLHLRPRLRVEEHPRVVAADAGLPFRGFSSTQQGADGTTDGSDFFHAGNYTKNSRFG